MAKIYLSSTEKLTLIANLSTLLTAGIPILESIESMLEEASGNSKKILETIKKDLNQGKTVSTSLARFPNAFDPVSVNLIKAAEEAGTLETTLKDLANTIKKDMETIDKVRAALTYPALVLMVFVFVVLLILIFIIPKIAEVFSKLKVNLPLPTQILIAISKFINDYIVLFSGMVAVLIFLTYFLYKTQRKTFINLMFSLPILSDVAKKLDLTRFTRSMALMLASGIPINNGLELSEKVVNKTEIAQAIVHIRNKVVGGKKISEGLKDYHKIFPGIMILITEAGEKSGSLEKSMQDLSEYFEEVVTSKIKTLTTLLEPILLIVLAILVGGMMLSIITPIYQLIGNLGAK